MSTDLLAHALVPVANPEDAKATARALAPYEPTHVTAVHVVEKGGGVPDKTPVEQSESLAEESYAIIHDRFPDADTHTAYGRNVVETIFETASEIDADSIAYRPRGGNRVIRFLSGDQSLKLVTEAPIPVVALPRADDDAP